MSPQGNTHTDILVAGAVAALSIDLLVYPLDTIKTRIQAPNYQKLYTNPKTGAVQRSLFRGLYQGIGSVILATVPSSGAFFTTYEASKSLLHILNSHLPPSPFTSPSSSSSTSSNSPSSTSPSLSNPFIPLPLLHSLSSSLAESVSCLILTPAEVLKQNAQIVQKPAPGTSGSSATKLFDVGATRAALKKFHRPSQLFRGYAALLGRNLPFTALQFPVFEGLKERLLEVRRGIKEEERVKVARESSREERDGEGRSGDEAGGGREGKRESKSMREGKDGSESDSDGKGEIEITMWERAMATGLAAAMSGSVAAFVTTPVDVVKTRIMLAAGEEGSTSATTTSSGSTTNPTNPTSSTAAAATTTTQKTNKESPPTKTDPRPRNSTAPNPTSKPLTPSSSSLPNKSHSSAAVSSISSHLKTTQSAQHSALSARRAKQVKLAAQAEKASRSTWGVAKEVFAEQGVRGFFRGAGLRAAWTALGSGLYLSVYESGRRWLEERRVGKEEEYRY